MPIWWQFVLILVAVVVAIALVFLVMSLPDVKRYLRIRHM